MVEDSLLLVILIFIKCLIHSNEKDDRYGEV